MNITVLGLTNPDVSLKRMHQLFNVIPHKHTDKVKSNEKRPEKKVELHFLYFPLSIK